MGKLLQEGADEFNLGVGKLNLGVGIFQLEVGKLKPGGVPHSLTKVTGGGVRH